MAYAGRTARASQCVIEAQHRKLTWQLFRIAVLLLGLGMWAMPTAAQSSSTLWGNATPSSISNDSNTYELGVNFYSDQAGYITAIRFYKGAGNTGTHVAHLWDSQGNLLSTATFTNETATGWQQVTLPTPVPINANTIYTASYADPNGHYALDSPYFTTQYNNAPLHAPADSASTPNGVYAEWFNRWPTQSYNSSNYWVDVVFSPSLSGPPPSGASDTLWGNATPSSISNDSNTYELGVNFYSDQAGYITAIRFYKGAGNTGTHVAHLWDSQGNLLSTATFTNETATGWQQVTLPTPVPINANTIYTASYADPNGHYALDRPYFTTQYNNAPLHAPADSASTPNGVYAGWFNRWPNLSDESSNYWIDVVFTPSSASPPPSVGASDTLWGNATPSSISSDSNTYELGVNFYSDQAGYITAIRFYKGAGNTGTHVAHLWDSQGNLLSTATFTNETATGWQQVTLPTPVPISANTIYTASYADPNGHYALDSPYFTTQYNNAPLHAPASSNGVYAEWFNRWPTQSYNSSNYWVDVVFSPTGVAGSPTPTLTLSLAPASLSFGALTIGGSSILPIVVTDTGTGSVILSQAAITGSGLSVTGPSLPFTLAAGQNTTFNVTFAPTSGGSVAGGLSITSNASNSPNVASISATGASPHSVSLSWSASTSLGIIGYNVYRAAVSGGPYTKINASIAATTSYTDTTVTGGQTYYYVTTAVSAQGTESTYSNQATAVVPSP